MKNLFCIGITGFVTVASLGQTPDYRTSLEDALAKYEKKAIQEKLLDENIIKAFNHVIFSTSDLVTNSSAFGYTQNEEKTTISLNTNLRLGKESSPLYANVGANTSGSSNIFEFYSEDTWKNNVSLNLGLIVRLGRSSVFFNQTELAKKKLNNQRRIYSSEPIIKSNIYNSEGLNTIANLKKDILNLRNRNDILSIYSGLLNELDEVRKLIEGKNFEKAFILLSSEEDKIKAYTEAFASQEKLDKYIEDNILYNFDKNNDVTYGYSLKWLDVNLNLGNSTYKFTKENVEDGILEEFNEVVDLTDEYNKLKSVISLNFNYTRNGQKTIKFGQLGVSATTGSFLENPLINGTPIIVKDLNQGYMILDENDRTLGRFNDIKNDFSFGSLNAYGAIFFTKAKNIGFNLALSHKYLLDKPDGTFFNNNFTALLGPIFRKEKDDQTSLTVGIDIGWQDAIYNTKINNEFVGRIRVGLPFNIYTKKKNDKS